MKYILIFSILFLSNTVLANERNENFGFKDLKIGVTGATFEEHCSRRVTEGYYICYDKADLLFRWVLPDLFMRWPLENEKVEMFRIEFQEPYMTTLSVENRYKELLKKDRIDWALDKYAKLSEELKSKYELAWDWQDPKFPDRRERELNKFFNKNVGPVGGLDTIFEDGKIILRMVLKKYLKAEFIEVHLEYRSKEIADNLMAEKLLEPTNRTKTVPAETDNSEF